MTSPRIASMDLTGLRYGLLQRGNVKGDMNIEFRDWFDTGKLIGWQEDMAGLFDFKE